MESIINGLLKTNEGLRIGHYAVISEDLKVGKNVQIGHHACIEKDVEIGDNVVIGNKVTLRSGTRISNNVIFDDHCITTGVCYLGDNVNVRTGAIISRSTIIEDYGFIGPGVITNHTKHVSHGRKGKVLEEQLLSYISYGSIIGSQASLLAGIHIGPQSIVGGGAVVIKDLPGRKVYVGSPCKPIMDIPPEYEIEQPSNAGSMYLTDVILGHFLRYMPALNFQEHIQHYKN